uniref:Uncharacterized protein n=1 Tax=Timema poppense TaxID=170557 RepID=A0A7R9D543_TIMPO|nr:unnamed protein product [Timema poppensis]
MFFLSLMLKELIILKKLSLIIIDINLYCENQIKNILKFPTKAEKTILEPKGSTLRRTVENTGLVHFSAEIVFI